MSGSLAATDLSFVDGHHDALYRPTNAATGGVKADLNDGHPWIQTSNVASSLIGSNLFFCFYFLLSSSFRYQSNIRFSLQNFL